MTEITFGRTLDANFSSLHIPAAIRRIDLTNTMYSVFAASVIVDENNPYFRSDGKALYSKDGKILYRLFPRYIEEYTVKNGTEILDENAFAEHENLKRIVLPDGLREIGNLCFDKCGSIEELSIPDSVAVIGKNSFMHMKSLQTLRLPENLKELGEMMLNMLTLTELYIPASIEHISDRIITANGTFIGKYTVSPENRFFRSENGVIYSKDMTALIKAPNSVPSGFEVPESVVRIAGRAFLNCNKLTEVVLPEGLKHIEVWAFFGCPLSDVTVPNSVIDIGESAFDPLHSITVCDTLKADPAFLFPSSTGSPLKKELIVKSSETGEIKGRIWSYIDMTDMHSLLNIYRGCFDINWNFDYDCFDRAFDKIGFEFTKACYAVYRLKNPPKPTPRAKAVFTDFLRVNGADILTERIDRGDFERFIELTDYMLTKDNIIEVADYSAQHNAVEFTAFLLDFRNKHFGSVLDNLNLD